MPRSIFKKKKKFFLKKKNQKKISMKQTSEFSKIKNFNSIQASRYGFYRQSDLRKEKIKKIISEVNPFLKNINSSDPLFISIKGLAKIFLGEIIEISKQFMMEKNDVVDPKDSSLHINHVKLGIKKYFKLI
jgi:hypothetical protein